MILRIKKLHPEAVLPKYLRAGDAGMDLYSCENMLLPPRERKLIPTGISMAIPAGYVGLIWGRSGLAAKNGIDTFGGVIDENYRGEIKVILYNSSKEPLQIEKGMRIAQMLIQEVKQKEIMEVDELDESVRGNHGFGSSGMK